MKVLAENIVKNIQCGKKNKGNDLEYGKMEVKSKELIENNKQGTTI